MRYGLGRHMLPEAVPHSLSYFPSTARIITTVCATANESSTPTQRMNRFISSFPPYNSSMSGSRQLLSKNAGSGP